MILEKSLNFLIHSKSSRFSRWRILGLKMFFDKAILNLKNLKKNVFVNESLRHEQDY